MWNPEQFIHEFTNDNLVTWKYGKVIYLFFNISLLALLSTHLMGSILPVLPLFVRICKLWLI